MIGLLVLSGCAPSSGRRPDLRALDKPNPKDDEPPAVSAGPGEATRFSADGKREKQWTLRWETASEVSFDEGKVSGTMARVSGTLSRKNLDVSDFSADRAIATKTGKTLRLEGNVRLVSRDPKASLRCDSVVWRPDLNRVEAKGNVRVDLPPWEMGVLPEVWARPDLSEAATPDMFGKNEHGSSR